MNKLPKAFLAMALLAGTVGSAQAYVYMPAPIYVPPVVVHVPVYVPPIVIPAPVYIPPPVHYHSPHCKYWPVHGGHW